MVGTDKRKTPEGRKQNLLIWYWGRRGGGAHYCLEVARELSRRGEFNVHLSISRNCDLYAELKALNLPGLDIDTYCDVGSALMALPRVRQVRRAFETYLEEHDIDLVLCTMQHLWNPFMLPAIRRAGSRYVVTIHDATLHPGERFLPYQWWLDWEIQQADGYVVLSDHVGRVLRARHQESLDRITVAPCGPFSQFTDTRRGCVGAAERPAPRRRRVGEHVGRVRDDNPAALAFLEIDVVETDGVVGDDAELRPGGIQQLGVDAVGQHGHEAVRACDALEEVGPRGRRLLVVNIDHERLLECES